MLPSSTILVPQAKGDRTRALLQLPKVSNVFILCHDDCHDPGDFRGLLTRVPSPGLCREIRESWRSEYHERCEWW